MAGVEATDRGAHAAFLDKYYGVSRHFYDVTRKYYLFGRDRVLDDLVREPFSSLIEVGPGTGRNLRRLHAKRPHLRLGGLEASRAMLEVAVRDCPFATFHQGFAEDVSLSEAFGYRPDRILFSYCLSMVQGPARAIEMALDSLAPGGELVIVDFGDFEKLPRLFGGALRGWLDWFHVRPLPQELFEQPASSLHFGPGRYFFIARLRGSPRSHVSTIA